MDKAVNKSIDFGSNQRMRALERWLADCRRRMGLRFPKINFDSDHWPIRTLYKTPQPDWYFSQYSSEFATKDASFVEVVRCLVTEAVLAGKPKNISSLLWFYRYLASALPHRFVDLNLQDLRKLESFALNQAKVKPFSADRLSTGLTTLVKQVSQLASKDVLPRLGFQLRSEVKAELRKIYKTYHSTRREGKAELLDHKMEAFNDALNALADNDPRLSPIDRVAIASEARALCAPSRINEILCSSIDDHFTVEDYAKNTIGEKDVGHRAHQMLLVTMKGSKGAQWSAKPVLNFMIDVFHYTTGIILDHGKRSRMLVEWYQKHPNTLYLPSELEHLRGHDLTRHTLAQIINLTKDPHLGAEKSAARTHFIELKEVRYRASNPVTHTKYGRLKSKQTIEFVPWESIEKLLLKKVHEAMTLCRKVTAHNYYEGDLSKMLFLFDFDKSPYLPSALSYTTIFPRLKQTTTFKAATTNPPTLFAKLDIKMPVNGKIVIAEMETHDPRRWLTTMALLHGDKLSDVLINKWANRCRLAQLKNYDFRTAEALAEFSKMPQTPKLNELTDISNGIAAAQKLEDEFGLTTAIVTANDAGISMTSMDLVILATENRPVATTSRGIIILYPQRFGICFHQHHEKPCRNYSNSLVRSCTTCNEGAYIKGHFPSNDETRKIAQQLFKSILRQLEKLALTHNRGIADDQDALGEHMQTLTKEAATLEDVAIHLIENFHQIKNSIKDKYLARRLEEAFVTTEVVKKLDDPNVSNGALIRYHNPTQHADPLLEVALDSHGGREQVALDEEKLIKVFPQFAPKALSLKDERHLLEPDGDKEDN